MVIKESPIGIGTVAPIFRALRLVLPLTLALVPGLAACGDGSASPRRWETAEELRLRQDRDFAASPDIRLPELRRRLAALGVADEKMKQATEEHGEPILLVGLDDSQFAQIDKRALARLLLDSRYRFELSDAGQRTRFAGYSVAEDNAREKAKAIKELAENGETDRIPRYRPGLDMILYARALEAYCGYGPREALRVIDGGWLEYNDKMASDAAVAAAQGKSTANFHCIRRVVYATDLGRQFIGNRGREGAIDY